MRKTLFVVYKSLASAYEAAQDLQRHGFGSGHVSFFTAEDNPRREPASEMTIANGSNFGALIGALTGLLVWGLTILSRTGPTTVVSPVSAVIGGLIGAGVGILVGAFIGGIAAATIHAALYPHRPEDDTLKIRPGNALLTVSISADGIDQAVSVLAGYRPVEIRYSNAAPGREASKSRADKQHYAAR